MESCGEAETDRHTDRQTFIRAGRQTDIHMNTHTETQGHDTVKTRDRYRTDMTYIYM